MHMQTYAKSSSVVSQNLTGSGSILQGEDVVRESGVPFAVVRPTALTEEDAGAEVVVDQGDVVKVGLHTPSGPAYPPTRATLALFTTCIRGCM
jgi:hypothetical protein